MKKEELTTFDEYELFTDSTAINPNADKDLIYPVLGLNGEAGEVAEKVKKLLRKDFELTGNVRRDIILELGDVLWYLTRCCRALGVSLKDVANFNVSKLTHRLKTDKIKGEGDNR